jgi:hypothetical protein
LLSSIRTLGRISFIAWVGLICILVSSTCHSPLAILYCTWHDGSTDGKMQYLLSLLQLGCKTALLLRLKLAPGRPTSGSSRTQPLPRPFRQYPR